MPSILLTTLLSAALLSLAACNSNQQAPAEPLSYDGLTPVSDTLMTRVWARKGFSLAGYRKVILEGAHIQFRPVTIPTENGRRSAATEFPVSQEQRQAFRRLIREEFETALKQLALEQVHEPGPDVLRVRGTFLDVVARPPPEDGNGQLIDTIGQATFVVELIDSQTNTVLVRALDTRSARRPGAASGTEDELRALFRRWANLLVDALNDLTTIDELQGS